MNTDHELKQDVSTKISVNTFFNIFGSAWRIILLLILTPFILKHIGPVKFGIWSIVNVLTGYLGLFDFGVGESFVKHIAEFYQKKDFSKLNEVIVTGFVICSMVSVIILCVSIPALDIIIKIFKIPSEFAKEAKFVFSFCILIFSIINALSIFRCVQTGVQRMDITNKLSVFFSIPLALGTIYALKNGYGLSGLVINEILFTILSRICDLVIAFRLIPQFKFKISFFSRKMMNVLLKFGLQMQVTKIACLVHFQTDKFLLAYFLNIQSVAFYEIASNLAFKLRAAPSLFLSAIFPAVSGLSHITNRELLIKIYTRSMKYLALLGLPICFAAVLFANPFIDLWLGPGYQKAALSFKILIIGYFFNLLTGPGFIILNGVGKPEVGLRSSLFAAIVNLLASIVLIIQIGFIGAAIGTTISLIIAAIYFLLNFHAIIKIPIIPAFNKSLLIPACACSLSFCLIKFFFAQMPMASWQDLFLAFLEFMLTFVLFIFLTRYLDDFDYELIKSFINRKK